MRIASSAAAALLLAACGDNLTPQGRPAYEAPEVTPLATNGATGCPWSRAAPCHRANDQAPPLTSSITKALRSSPMWSVADMLTTPAVPT